MWAVQKNNSSNVVAFNERLKTLWKMILFQACENIQFCWKAERWLRENASFLLFKDVKDVHLQNGSRINSSTSSQGYAVPRNRTNQGPFGMRCDIQSKPNRLWKVILLCKAPFLLTCFGSWRKQRVLYLQTLWNQRTTSRANFYCNLQRSNCHFTTYVCVGYLAQ